MEDIAVAVSDTDEDDFTVESLDDQALDRPIGALGGFTHAFSGTGM